MFKRRIPQQTTRQMREMLWPSMGWKRALFYFQHRIFRQATSTYKIAGGIATGISVSFTPLLGLHFVQCMVYAHIFRQSKIASLVGNTFGNPWTLPPMFYLDYKLGYWIISFFRDDALVAMPHEHTISNFLNEPLRLFLPMMVGGVILALVSWPIAYLILYKPVHAMQRAYRKRRLIKLRLKKQLKAAL